MPAQNQIMKELHEIKKELKAIRETMPEKDMFLTAEEEVLLAESIDHEARGKLISAKDLRKELGL